MDRSQALLDYYDHHLATHGDTALGAAWPNAQDRLLRFRMGVEIILAHATEGPIVLCDLGCGTGELLRYLRDAGLGRIRYVGIDRSEQAIRIARDKFPDAEFHCADLEACSQAELDRLAECDFVFANGLFTVRHTLTRDEMWRFMEAMLGAVWGRARQGIVFNVMSTLVDWEREDLFHVSYDEAARFMRRLGGGAIGFEAHHSLHEFMAYALKGDGQLARRPDPVARQPGMTDEQAVAVPVCRPRLPPAAAVLSYLSEADRSRRYTNHGVLSERLTRGLAGLIGHDGLCLASSGTTALVGAILARAGRATAQRPLALCPAYTFVATALALELAGYEPVLVDVDESTWALTPGIARQQPLERVGLVVATAPYGREFRADEWTLFSRGTGIPVVIDAAAGFEAVCADPGAMVGETPVVLSFHATKAFSTGEGGAIVCTDPLLVKRAYAALNFGFQGTRECIAAGMNGKMSEYHAAVGLAELAGWPAKRTGFLRVAECYRAAAVARGLSDRVITAPQVASSYALFVGREAAESDAVQLALQASGLDCRRWYGQGLHEEPYFRGAARGTLSVTRVLAPRVLGLPMAPDLADANVERVLAAIALGVESHRFAAGRPDPRPSSCATPREGDALA